MLKPQENTSFLINQLLDILRSGGDLGCQEFEIFRKIKQLNSNDASTDLAWALFYFCQKNINEADKFFNRAIRYGDLECVGNYITFLMHIGEIRKAISIKNRYKKNILSSQDSRGIKTLSDIALCEGDFIAMKSYLEEAKLRGKSYNWIAEIMENILKGYELFMEVSTLTSEQVLWLFDEMIDIFEEYHFDNLGSIRFEIDSFHDINAVTVFLSTDDLGKLIDANFEIASRVAEETQFVGKKFVASFELYDDEEKDLGDALLCQ